MIACCSRVDLLTFVLADEFIVGNFCRVGLVELDLKEKPPRKPTAYGGLGNRLSLKQNTVESLYIRGSLIHARCNSPFLRKMVWAGPNRRLA